LDDFVKSLANDFQSFVHGNTLAHKRAAALYKWMFFRADLYFSKASLSIWPACNPKALGALVRMRVGSVEKKSQSKNESNNE